MPIVFQPNRAHVCMGFGDIAMAPVKEIDGDRAYVLLKECEEGEVGTAELLDRECPIKHGGPGDSKEVSLEFESGESLDQLILTLQGHRKRVFGPKGHCCEFMKQQLESKCEQHGDGADCPNVIIKKGKEIRQIIGRNGSYECNFCPYCGDRQEDGPQ